MKKFFIAFLFISTPWLDISALDGGVRPHYPQEAAEAGIGGVVTVEYWVKADCELEATVVESDPAGMFDEATLLNVQRFVHDQQKIDWESIPEIEGGPEDIISQEELYRRSELVEQRGPWPILRSISIPDTESGYLRRWFSAEGELTTVEYREGEVTKWALEQSQIARTNLLVEPRSLTIEYSIEGP